MSKHTPGPWLAVKYSAKRFGLGCPGGGAWALIQAVDTDADDPEMRANARLISAAPELLECLQQLIDGMVGTDDSVDGVLRRSLAAIAKATGDTNA